MECNEMKETRDEADDKGRAGNKGMCEPNLGERETERRNMRIRDVGTINPKYSSKTSHGRLEH